MADERNRETDALLVDAPEGPSSQHTETEYRHDETSPRALKVIVIVSAVLLMSDLAGYMAFAPQLDIYESIICEQYFARSGNLTASVDTGDRLRCKIAPVQSELALINGWSETFSQIPGLILAIPYGALADHIGRKPVLLLGISGCILGEAWIRFVCLLTPTIPFRAVWLSAVTTLVGGGSQTVQSMIWVMVADVCSVKRRTTAFSQLAAAVLIPEIVIMPLSATLMSKGSWLPYMISFAMYTTAFLTALWVPETLAKGLQSDPPAANDADIIPNNANGRPKGKSILKRYLKEINKVQDSLHAMRQNNNVLLILLFFFVTFLGKPAVLFLLQYARKRFDWTYAQTSYVLSLRGSVDLLMLFILLPAMSELLSIKLKLDAAVKDRYITQSGVALSVTGYALIFLAASPWLFVIGFVVRASGAAASITARSLITSMVDQNLLGTVYTAIGTVTSGGMMLAGPLMAYAFKWAMQLDEFWLGMPFLVAACLHGLGLLMITYTKVNKRGR